MALSNKRTACPLCRQEGRDSKGDHLRLFEDGTGGWCYQGGHGKVMLDSGGDGVGERGPVTYSRPSTVDDAYELARVRDLKSLPYPERKISTETMEFFGVKGEVSQETGDLRALFYPYPDEDGSVTGYKKRVLPKQFSVLGKIKSMFGKDKAHGDNFILVVEGECLSGDTEVLTPSGWVRLDEYNNEDVLSVDFSGRTSGDALSATFRTPLAYIKKPYTGDLLTYSNKQVDFTCTPNHGMIVESRTPGEGWVKVPFGETGVSQRSVPKTAVVDGPGIALTDQQIALCVALSADAYFLPNKRQAKINVKKERKKERLRSILSACGIEWSEWTGKTRPDFTEFKFTVPDYCTRRLFCWDWISLATKDQREFLLNELIEWDGNRVPNRNQIEYSSKYLDNCEWVQALAHTAGYSATIIPRKNQYGSWYKVSVLFGKSTATFVPKKAATTKSEDGFVYCVQVPTGAFLCRRNQKVMVIGNSDVLACREMMRVLKPDTRPYNVVSVPNGANEEGTLDATTKRELEWLAKFKKVVLVLDTDAPGKATARSIAEYLSSSTDVRIATLPLKDSAAMWEAGREKEWASAINAAKPYEDDCVTSGDSDWDDLEEPLASGRRYTFLPRTCDKLHGFRTSEVTGWIAEANVGKSSILRQMMYEDLLLDPECRVGALFLEEKKKKTKQSILAYHCGVPLNKYRANPSLGDPELKRHVREHMFPRLHVYEYTGKEKSLLLDEHILRKITFMVKALGCKRIYVDHLSYIVGAMDTKDERRSIDMFLTKLARSVEDLDYSLNLVSHIKRGEREQARTDSKQKYPYWEILGMHDARGSGAIAQLCHNMVAVEREVLDPNLESTRGKIRTRVLRAREWGFTGLGDVLTFDDEGKFKPVVIEEFS